MILVCALCVAGVAGGIAAEVRLMVGKRGRSGEPELVKVAE